MGADELFAELLKDELFYDDSGGGVTFSGGEPLIQHEFLLEILARCRGRGLRTAVDTCGYVNAGHLLAAAKLADLFLFDLKLMDPARHKHYTGVSNALILENLRELDRAGVPIWLRIPLVPGVNDSPEELRQMAELARSLPAVRQVHLLPFHQSASAKLGRLGRENLLADTATPTPGQMEESSRHFLAHGLKTIIGG
jgi:pyruvate formate lyase activating enzyme